MNGRERIDAALSITEPDRVPMFIHGINEGPIIGIGRHITDGLPEVKPVELMSDAEKVKLIETLFKILDHYDIDGYTCLPMGEGTEHVGDDVPFDDWGVGYTRSEHGIPVPSIHPLSDPGKLARFAPPEPRRSQLVLVDLMRDRFRGSKSIFWMMRGVFVRSWRLVGMQNYMFQLIDNPEFLHTVAHAVVEFNLRQLELCAEAGVDVLIIEDDIADRSSVLISPAHYREFVFPYNRLIVDAAHKRGLKVVRHSDGNLWPILDMLVEAGYDGLNPLEPQAGMLLKKVKEYCGDRLCLLGNIDCVKLLPNGTPEEVEAAVKSAIADAGAGGGLIIDSSNSFHPGVNPENCIAMFKAVRRHGIYPLQGTT